MIMKTIYYLCLLLLPLYSFAQKPARQPGRVRTITYSKYSKGNPISDVQIKVQTETRSDAAGFFTLSIVPSKENTFTFDRIFKAGYSLVSPESDKMQSKTYPINEKTNVEIILVKNNELVTERQRIEKNIRMQKEKEIAKYDSLLIEKKTIISQLKVQNSYYKKLIVEKDSMEKAFQEFVTQYNESDLLITAEANRLAHIDYEALDSIELKSVKLSKAGKWQEAAEYNKSFISEAVAQAIPKNIEQKEKELEEALNLRNFYSKRYKETAANYAQGFKNDSASVYYDKYAAINPTDFFALLECCSFYETIRQYSKAEEYCLKALEVAPLQVPFEKESIAIAYETLGHLYDKTGKYSDAYNYYKKALDLHEKESIETINVLNGLGNLVTQMNDSLYTAIGFYERALEISKREYGKEDAHVATEYTFIATTYAFKNEYSTALDYYHKALDIYSDTDSTQIVSVLDQISHIYLLQGKYSEALDCVQKAINLKEALPGDDSSLFSMHCSLAHVYGSMGNFKQAIEILQTMLVEEQSVWAESPHISTIYGTLAKIYYDMEDYENAIIYKKKELEREKKYLGSNHPNIGQYYVDLGQMYYMEKKNLDLAIEYYNKAIKSRERTFGEESLEVNLIRESMVWVLMDKAGYFAEKNDTANCQIYTGKTVDTIIKAIEIYGTIGDKYYTDKDSVKCARCYQKQLELGILIKLYDNKYLIENFEIFGDIYQKRHEYRLALDAFSHSLHIREEEHGINHINTQLARSYVFELRNTSIEELQFKGNLIEAKKLMEEDQKWHNETIHTAIILEGDHPAFNKGLRGVYYILKYEDWETGIDTDIFLYNGNLKGKPKKIVLMKDEVITSYQFDNVMGIAIGTYLISIPEKQKIVEAYHKWANNN